jgi:protocatechuate 3,4-dioxygenase beta subunit
MDKARRKLLQALVAIPALGWAGRDVALPATPECGDDDGPTPSQTEGPYFKRSSPQRSSLIETGVTGTKLVLTGQVLSTGCQPIARALLDFWHADGTGVYDLRGFRLRGHQFTDTAGRFELETIVPGLYAGRTRHIHVRVQAPNGRILTTQLYFPREPANARDRMFSSALLVDLKNVGSDQRGLFDFIVKG